MATEIRESVQNPLHKPGVAPEGQAFLLMMEHRWQRLQER